MPGRPGLRQSQSLKALCSRLPCFHEHCPPRIARHTVLASPLVPAKGITWHAADRCAGGLMENWHAPLKDGSVYIACKTPGACQRETCSGMQQSDVLED
eukprot:scaffold202034_cov19-Tisochrysis_lutea.AAC.1